MAIFTIATNVANFLVVRAEIKVVFGISNIMLAAALSLVISPWRILSWNASEDVGDIREGFGEFFI